jgi:hypothetical protein
LKRYYYTATVERTVVDTINLCVEAIDDDDAYKIVAKAVEVFPEPLGHDNIKHMYVDNRQSLSSKLIDLERKIPSGATTD